MFCPSCDNETAFAGPGESAVSSAGFDFSGQNFSLGTSLIFRFFHQCSKVFVMPAGSWFFKINIMEEAAWNLLLSEILPDTERASLIMIRRMVRTPVICTCAEFFFFFHFAISFSVSPVSR